MADYLKEYKQKRIKEIKKVIEDKKQADWLLNELMKLEQRTEYETGVRLISGGFAEATVYDEDEEKYYVEVRWGIQNDCENVVHTEGDWYINKVIKD